MNVDEATQIWLLIGTWFASLTCNKCQIERHNWQLLHLRVYVYGLQVDFQDLADHIIDALSNGEEQFIFILLELDYNLKQNNTNTYVLV